MNYLSNIFPVLIAYLIFCLDHIWRDKRTNKYKMVRRGLISIIIPIAIMISIRSTYNDRESIKKAESQRTIINENVDGLKNIIATSVEQQEMKSLLFTMYNIISTEHERLNIKYPDGYYLFATGANVIVPYDLDTRKMFDLDWENTKAEIKHDKYIYITTEKFIYNPINTQFFNVTIILNKEVGSKFDRVYFKDTQMTIEIIDIIGEAVTYVIGFKKSKEKLQSHSRNIVITGFNASYFDSEFYGEGIKIQEDGAQN